MTEPTSLRKVIRYRDRLETVEDDIVVEEPMEIRLNGESTAVVMRTPGHEADLALGFAITEGIVTRPESVEAVEDLGEGRWNLRLAPEAVIDPGRFRRNFYSTSSCGVCGKASIDAIRVTGAFPPAGPVVGIQSLLEMPAKLYEYQAAFHKTGGLHAAAAFTPAGDIVAVREDVGRHNAVDKLVGHLAHQAWPLPPLGLLVSGRVSFEIVQKAAVAGISLVCGVSAASSLAVDLGQEFGMTVIGFLREAGLTLYTGSRRVQETEAKT